MTLNFNDKKVEVVVCVTDHHCDSYFESGYYLDNDFTELTDDELIKLTDIYQDKISEYAMEQTGFWRD